MGKIPCICLTAAMQAEAMMEGRALANFKSVKGKYKCNKNVVYEIKEIYEFYIFYFEISKIYRVRTNIESTKIKILN